MLEITVREFLQRYENPFRTVIVHEGDTIGEILAKMIERNEERIVFVADEQNRLKGIITAGTLARHVMHEEISPNRGFLPASSIIHYLTAEHARDIMDKDVVYCKEEEPLEEAFAKMFGKKIDKTIPVVDDEMHIVDSLNIISIIAFRLKNGSE
jgi:CBS domain-containing protein